MKYESATFAFWTLTRYKDFLSENTTGWSFSFAGRGIGITLKKEEGIVESWSAVLQ